MSFNSANIPDGRFEPGDWGAADSVRGAINNAEQAANSALQSATTALNSLAQITFEPVTIEYNLEPAPDFGVDISNPPDVPEGSLPSIGSPPQVPTFTTPNTSGLVGSAPPPYNLSAPSVNVPQPPPLVAPDTPGPAPIFSETLKPVYTPGEIPPVPTLSELQLPDKPVFSLDHLNVDRPEFSLPYDHLYDNDLVSEANNQFEVHWHKYSDLDPDSDLMRDRWREMLSGGTGLPAVIEQAIFDRGVEREEVSTEQARRQATEQWSARGFSLPGSTVLAAQNEVAKQSRIERGRLNREITIYAHEKELENLRFAVEQGVRLEGQRFEQFIRIVDAARTTIAASYEVARNLLQSRIDILRAEIDVYQSDIQAYREAVQTELIHLEAYRTELEAARIQGQINQQEVDLYTARLQGVLANVEVFKAEVDAVNSQVRAQVAEMEGYRARVGAYQAAWGAEQTKMDAYVASIQGERAKVDIFDSQVRAFASRVQAYSAEMTGRARAVEAESGVNNVLAQSYNAAMTAWRSGVTEALEQHRAMSQRYSAMMQGYTAKSSAESAKANAEASYTRVLVAHAQAEASGQMSAAQVNAEQARAAEQMAVEAQRGIAQTSAQMAAAAYSAYNVGASISASASQSAAWNTSRSASNSTSYNENMSGEI